MNNNINNGVNSNVNTGTNVELTSGNVSNSANVVNSGGASTPNLSGSVVSNNVVTPGTVSNIANNTTATPIVNAVPVTNTIPHTTTATTGVNTVPNSTVAVNTLNNPVLAPNNTLNNQDGIATNTYILVGTIAGIVILVSVFLLVLLVTGVIGNRNRLTCTKTVDEAGYVYTENRVYRFDNGPYYSRIDKSYTFDYANLTDDMYNEQYVDLIDNPNTVSLYGFGTNIFREGNRVIITAYDPKIFDRTVDEVVTSNKIEGFTCD